MTAVTKHIKNPSSKLLALMDKIKKEKDERREYHRAKADVYFPLTDK